MKVKGEGKSSKGERVWRQGSDQANSVGSSQDITQIHNRSVHNEGVKQGIFKEQNYHPADKRSHNVYSSMFSDGSLPNSQANSIMISSVETSQNSLRQAIMSTIKRKTSK